MAQTRCSVGAGNNLATKPRSIVLNRNITDYSVRNLFLDAETHCCPEVIDTFGSHVINKIPCNGGLESNLKTSGWGAGVPRNPESEFAEYQAVERGLILMGI